MLPVEWLVTQQTESQLQAQRLHNRKRSEETGCNSKVEGVQASGLRSVSGGQSARWKDCSLAVETY